MKQHILDLSNSELLGWYNFTSEQYNFYAAAAAAMRQENNTIGAIEIEANAKDMMKRRSAFNAVLLIRLNDIEIE